MGRESKKAGARPAFFALACSSDDGLSPSALAGTYSATTFTIVGNVDTTDVLAAGGELTLSLFANGATSGQLTVPASTTGSGDFTATMVGTYAVSGRTVHFSQGADTFVRDMAFTVVGSGAVLSLAGSATFSDTTVNVMLTRGGELVPAVVR